MFEILFLLLSLEPNKIGLTFDDGPTKESHKLIELLYQENVSAMFFPAAIRLEYDKDFAAKAIFMNHEFGNHTYSHAELPYLTREKSILEIMKAQKIFLKNKIKPHWFRFPSGKKDKRIYSILKQNEYFGIADWDAFSGDISGDTTEKMTKKVMRNAKNQKITIVLYHDCKFGVTKNVIHLLNSIKNYNKNVNILNKGEKLIIFENPSTLFPRRENGHFFNRYSL